MIRATYDYALLNQPYDCRLQMGGSDQWGTSSMASTLAAAWARRSCTRWTIR